MKFENYPELRNELRLKVAKKVFDKMNKQKKIGVKKIEWAKKQLDIWNSVEDYYIPEEYAEYIRMTDKKCEEIIEKYKKKLEGSRVF
tara:strand:+ start:200 stop:460 length:261 start_codon:yes stop_codon:yes gene_type:complete